MDEDHMIILPCFCGLKKRVGDLVYCQSRTAFHHCGAVDRKDQIGVRFLDEFTCYRLTMKAGFTHRPGGVHAQFIKDKPIARLLPKGAECAVVVQQDQRLIRKICDLGIQRTHLITELVNARTCNVFLVERFAQRLEMIPNGTEQENACVIGIT